MSQFEIAGDFNDDFVGGLEEVAFRCWCFGCCRRFWFGHLREKASFVLLAKLPTGVWFSLSPRLNRGRIGVNWIVEYKYIVMLKIGATDM